MEVVGSGPGPEVGPEEVHHLLPVEPVIPGQAEQLDYAGGLPEPPPVLLHDARSHGDFETPEQGYAQASPAFRYWLCIRAGPFGCSLAKLDHDPNTSPHESKMDFARFAKGCLALYRSSRVRSPR